MEGRLHLNVHHVAWNEHSGCLSPSTIAMSMTNFMQVFYGIPFQKGDRILTSVHEYAANYIAYLQVCRSLEIALTVIKGSLPILYANVDRTCTCYTWHGAMVGEASLCNCTGHDSC